MDRKHQEPTTAQDVRRHLMAEGFSQDADGWPTDVLATADTSVWY